MRITAIRPSPSGSASATSCSSRSRPTRASYGWGESGLSGREKAVVGAVEHYAEFLIGRDPMRIGALWQEMYRSQYFEGGRVLTAAISAIDIALHDIKGKALGVPVYELLGGKQRDRDPDLRHHPAAPGPGDDRAGARMLIERGWNCMRLFPRRARQQGRSTSRASTSPRRRAGCVKAREALGGDVVLGVDYHHRLSVAEAASLLPADAARHARLPRGADPRRDAGSLRSAAHGWPTSRSPSARSSRSKWQFLPYIERGIHQFNRIDICNVGGFTEAMKVAGWCEAHYVDLMPHNPLGPVCTAATRAFRRRGAELLLARMPRHAGRDQLGFDDRELFPVQMKLEGATYIVPDAPGLGVEVDEAQLAKQTFKFWEAPHLRRADG